MRPNSAARWMIMSAAAKRKFEQFVNFLQNGVVNPFIVCYNKKANNPDKGLFAFFA